MGRIGGRGVIYIAVGDKAASAYERSAASLPHGLSHKVIRIAGADNVTLSRELKTRLYELSPWEFTLYLDADTIPHGDICAGFEIIEDGWDVAIAPSDKQGVDCLWHIAEDERTTTFRELGRRPLQLQAGVIFFRRSAAVCGFFMAWRDEWERYRGQDQGAFLRALERAPVRVWLLGRPWNGGAVIAHRFGDLRQLL